MSKTYLPYEPDQQLLLPAALQKWLPDDHLAYFISDVVDQLDMSEVTARYERERRGGPPYHPRMMVKVLLYGYCVGVASSRRIAQRLHEDIAFRVLAANNTPDFRTISDFRKDNLDALSGLFVQVLALCQQAGLVKLGHVALDGTKVKANASKHKAMSYQRMKEKAAQLAAEVAELLRQAQQRMMRKTGGTAKTSVEMSCRRSWPFESVGGRRYGKPWRHWKPRRRRLPNRPRPKVVSTRGCPTTRPSVTSPIPSRASSPHLEERTSCKRTTVRRWWTALTR